MELNGRKINAKTVQVDGSINWTGGRIHDPYFAYAEYDDGTQLTEENLEELNQVHDVFEWLD